MHPVAGEADGVCAERVGEGEDMCTLRPGNRKIQDVVSITVIKDGVLICSHALSQSDTSTSACSMASPPHTPTRDGALIDYSPCGFSTRRAEPELCLPDPPALVPAGHFSMGSILFKLEFAGDKLDLPSIARIFPMRVASVRSLVGAEDHTGKRRLKHNNCGSAGAPRVKKHHIDSLEFRFRFGLNGASRIMLLFCNGEVKVLNCSNSPEEEAGWAFKKLRRGLRDLVEFQSMGYGNIRGMFYKYEFKVPEFTSKQVLLDVLTMRGYEENVHYKNNPNYSGLHLYFQGKTVIVFASGKAYACGTTQNESEALAALAVNFINNILV